MGTDRRWQFHGKEFTAESISSLILRSLVDLVEDGPGKTPVVITVPAYFGAKEREATRNAGEIANLEVLNLVPEPVAAALFYDAQAPLKGKNLLVYDLGGGTFDVTAVRGEDNVFDIVATDGDARLGGADWDRMLSEYLLDRFIEATSDEEAEADETFRLKLQEQAVACKEALSAAQAYTVRLASDTGSRAKIKVTREEFEQLTAPLLERTELCMERLFKQFEAKQPGFEFDEVILVGGSSRMAAVGDLVQRATGLIPRIFGPDLAIAKGAAISATISQLQVLAGKGADSAEAAVAEYARASGIDAAQLAALSTKKVLNVIPKAIGFKVYDSSTGEPFIDHVIAQNTTIPLVQTACRHYLTLEDDQQAVELTLYQQASDIASEDPALNEVITGSEARLLGIPALPKGQPIKIEVDVAGDGLITVQGTHLPSGKSMTSNVRIGVMSEAEIAKAKESLKGMRVSTGDAC
ncbi:Chaperone protein DnaK [Corynebacterium pseudopelargi]|uniref:Chaperone protein DnaK n=2 Tax=Corynebacterium pseudopelargi TaxID=2080757 RepID=A0A3G6IS72_9CORY|nr:Chaperone protein DnaK [Corynebacterium pseudopelargi]